MLEEAAAVAVAFLNRTGQGQKNQAFRLFHELATRTVEQASQGRGTEFTAENLKQGVAPDTLKDPSGWVSPLWKLLVKLEPQWREGLVETARSLGIPVIPKLAKRADSPAHHYFLQAEPLAAPAELVAPSTEVPLNGVRYTAEAVAAPAAWLRDALRSGVLRWSRPLRIAVAGSIVILIILAALAFWVFVTAALHVTRPLSLADVFSTCLMAAAAVGVVATYRFVDDLFELGIVMAPEVLTPISQANVTLELRRGRDEENPGQLAFVRYSTLCPRCDSPVAIFPGGKHFPGRLVGRCRSAGREHVYSFDHVSRVGGPLR